MASRHIEVKSLFTPDEFLELKAECAAADVKHSPLLRTLAKNWVDERKRKRMAHQPEWPAYGQNMAMFLPSRAARPRMHMRL